MKRRGPWRRASSAPPATATSGPSSASGFRRSAAGRCATPTTSARRGSWESSSGSPSATAPASRPAKPCATRRLMAARSIPDAAGGAPGGQRAAPPLPLFPGGPPGPPLRHGDDLGAAGIVGELERLAERSGPRFAPSEALRDQAAHGGKFYP